MPTTASMRGHEESDGQAGAGTGPDAGPEVLADGVGTPDEALFTGGDVAVLDAGDGVHGAEVGVYLTGQVGLQNANATTAMRATSSSTATRFLKKARKVLPQ